MTVIVKKDSMGEAEVRVPRSPAVRTVLLIGLFVGHQEPIAESR